MGIHHIKGKALKVNSYTQGGMRGVMEGKGEGRPQLVPCAGQPCSCHRACVWTPPVVETCWVQSRSSAEPLPCTPLRRGAPWVTRIVS